MLQSLRNVSSPSFLSRSLALAGLLLAAGAPAFAADCAALAKQAGDKEVRYSPPSSYAVTGTGRLYFYTAPDSSCRDARLFIIPADRVTAYSEYQGYTSVMYVNPKSHEDFQGWVETRRLAFVGTIAPQ